VRRVASVLGAAAFRAQGWWFSTSIAQGYTTGQVDGRVQGAFTCAPNATFVLRGPTAPPVFMERLCSNEHILRAT